LALPALSWVEVQGHLLASRRQRAEFTIRATVYVGKIAIQRRVARSFDQRADRYPIEGDGAHQRPLLQFVEFSD
jgi:hypothetical protein